MNAASKLAAMAKVLETPVAKKKFQRNQDVQGTDCFQLFVCCFHYYLICILSRISHDVYQNVYHRTISRFYGKL